MINTLDSENWARASKRTNLELFSELDILLRALDRCFGMENLKDRSSGKNFFAELNAVGDVIFRVTSVLEAVIPEDQKNAYWFQKFAETKLLTNRKRDLFMEEMYRQDSPEKSLYLLYDAFVNLKTVVADILKNKTITYMSFKNIGQIISKQIRENIFFNPFRQDMDPELDFIENRRISNIVRNIEDKDTKKIISIIFLHQFRFLRCMRHMDLATPYHVALHSSLLILMLLRSEIAVFLTYMGKVFGRLKNPELLGLLQGISYQYSMETKRVFLQELKDIENKSPQQMRGRIENSHGILKNLTEQTIIQLAQFWEPEVQGEDIFDSFITKTEQSLKLRDDIFVLERLITLFEKSSPDERNNALDSLRHFMKYFENLTFRLLRHDDYEEFSSFFEEITAASNEAGNIEKLFERCHLFKVFLNTTLRQVENRAELRDRPMDTKRVDGLVKQYL